MAGVGRVIIRVEHTDHFTVVRNKTLRDSRLSYKARGLLAYLLSLPDDAALSRDYLADVAVDGIRSVRAGLKELADAGYITYEKHQDERGQWRTEATVFECSTEGAKRAIGKGSEPKARNSKPKARNATVGNRASSRKTKEGPAHASPPPPPEEVCAACGEPARYMRADETWFCDEHRALRLVGDGEA